jgi:hypothetical protein
LIFEKESCHLFFQIFKVDLNDFTKNNVCISGMNGDFGPLASYNPSAPSRPLIQKYFFARPLYNEQLYSLIVGSKVALFSLGQKT